eukprot:807182-Prymnesium_polylepis.1
MPTFLSAQPQANNRSSAEMVTEMMVSPIFFNILDAPSQSSSFPACRFLARLLDPESLVLRRPIHMLLRDFTVPPPEVPSDGVRRAGSRAGRSSSTSRMSAEERRLNSDGF